MQFRDQNLRSGLCIVRKVLKNCTMHDGFNANQNIKTEYSVKHPLKSFSRCDSASTGSKRASKYAYIYSHNALS